MKSNINNALTVVTDGTGAATFTSQIPPMGEAWIITIFIVNATASSAHTAYKNGMIVGQWTGGNTYGPIQIQSGEALTIKSTLLTANTNYQAIQQGAGFSGPDLQNIPFLLPTNTSIPAPAAPSIQYVQAAVANTLYKSTSTFINGIYTITCPTTVVTQCDFYDANGNLIVSAVTVTGTVSVNLATTAVQMDYWTTSGTSVSIGIQLTGSNIQYAPSGPLTTITANQINALVGDYYAVLVGGAKGGEDILNGATYSGAGGRSGNVWQGRVKLVGGETITIGQGTSHAIAPANPTDTTLGTYTSANGVNVAGGGRLGGNGSGQLGTINPTPLFPFLQITTSSGGGGAFFASGGPYSGGSTPNGTVGTGGWGGAASGTTPPYSFPGQDGTGYGAGGGGAGNSQFNGAAIGGNGTNGVLYLIG